MILLHTLWAEAWLWGSGWWGLLPWTLGSTSVGTFGVLPAAALGNAQEGAHSWSAAIASLSPKVSPSLSCFHCYPLSLFLVMTHKGKKESKAGSVGESGKWQDGSVTCSHSGQRRSKVTVKAVGSSTCRFYSYKTSPGTPDFTDGFKTIKYNFENLTPEYFKHSKS